MNKKAIKRAIGPKSQVAGNTHLLDRLPRILHAVVDALPGDGPTPGGSVFTPLVYTAGDGTPYFSDGENSGDDTFMGPITVSGVTYDDFASFLKTISVGQILVQLSGDGEMSEGTHKYECVDMFVVTGVEPASSLCALNAVYIHKIPASEVVNLTQWIGDASSTVADLGNYSWGPAFAAFLARYYNGEGGFYDEMVGKTYAFTSDDFIDAIGTVVHLDEGSSAVADFEVDAFTVRVEYDGDRLSMSYFR